MSNYEKLEMEVTFIRLDVNGKTGETTFRFETPELELGNAVKAILFIEGDFAVGVGYEDDDGVRYQENIGLAEYDRMTVKKDKVTVLTFKSSITKLKLPVDRIQQLLERNLLLSLLKKV